MQKVTIRDSSNWSSTTMIALIMFFLFAGTLNSIVSGAARVGMGSLLILMYTSCLILYGSYIKEQEIPKYNWTIARWGFVHMGISIINLFYNMSSRGVNNIAQFFLCLSFVLFISNLSWREKDFRLLGKMASWYAILNFIYWLVSGRVIPFLSIYSNSNIFGSYIVFLLFFILLGRHYSKKRSIFNLGIILSLALIMFSDTRSAMLAFVAIVIVYIFWNSITKGRKKFYVIFWILMIGIIAFIFLYPKLPMWPQFYTVSNFMYKYTGKNLLSGRDDIWLTLVNLISYKPLLGYGPGAVPSELSLIQASSHNLFLQITLQNGYIGLTTFVLFLSSFWKRFWVLKTSYHTRLAASFFVGILIHQSFEIALTQNQLSVGLIQWLIVGIGISRIANLEEPDNIAQIDLKK
ncbi:O-antigen ligase family protein [Carnobacterium maltaromaticum]|uniref:O-antigen ligase family protein n=1 Tax=Carnobacterium maltaromaticum TaxID=2751 RepID=UPI0039B02D7E